MNEMEWDFNQAGRFISVGMQFIPDWSQDQSIALPLPLTHSWVLSRRENVSLEVNARLMRQAMQ